MWHDSGQHHLSIGHNQNVIHFDSILRASRFQARNGSVTVSRYKGLFNGLGTILLGSVPASAMYWTIYERVKTSLQEKTNQNPRYFPFCEMVAATLGEIVAASIRNPFEVTKQFIQIRIAPNLNKLLRYLKRIVAASIRNPFEVTKQFIQIRGYSNPIKAIMEISKERGLRSLYSGYSSLLLRDIPFDIIEVVHSLSFDASFSCMKRRNVFCFATRCPSRFMLIRRDKKNCIGTRICRWVS